MPKRKKPVDIVIYKAKDGKVEFRGDFERETIWATQAKIAQIFGVTPQNVTMHVRKIYKDKELSRKATCKESLHVQKESHPNKKGQMVALVTTLLSVKK